MVKRREGRPTKYNPQLANKICDLLMQGISVNTMCKQDGMPVAGSVFNWLYKYPEFLDKYKHAKEVQAHVFEEQAIAIADDDTFDEVFTEDGKRLENREFINRSKLRVETRKWAAKVNLPKKYGDRAAVELSGTDGGPIQFTDTELAAKIQHILVLAKERKEKTSK